MRFATVSGSEYEIVNHPAGKMIRRVNDNYGKRADGDWIRLLNTPELWVGFPAYLKLGLLSKYGPDDEGNEVEEGFTWRTTSSVKWVEGPENVPF